MNKQHDHNQSDAGEDKVDQKSNLVLVCFLFIIGYFLWMEHRAHVIEFLPYLLLAACPLMHFFMHRGHGHHHGSHENEKNEKGD